MNYIKLVEDELGETLFDFHMRFCTLETSVEQAACKVRQEDLKKDIAIFLHKHIEKSKQDSNEQICHEVNRFGDMKIYPHCNHNLQIKNL